MKKPNFIVIYCDDLGYGDLGCYGSDTVATPHLDRLAAGGIRFTNWYSNSPVCSPSRASLLTGRYPARTGIEGILGGKRGTSGLPGDEMTIAKALKGAGYSTAMFGKWHLGTASDNTPNAHGFDEFFGFLAGCVDYYSHIFYWGMEKGVNPVHDLWHNDKEVWSDGSYLTELLTSKTIEYIEQQHDEPFFLYLSYNAPHYPMHAPEMYMKRFEHLPWDRQVMAAMIAAVDDGVGSIVDALKRQGLDDNTLIFFSSDNGPSSETRNWLDGTEDYYYGGSKGVFRGYKSSLFDGGIREPAILYGPSIVQRSEVAADHPYMMADIFPTFLALAGAELPEGQIIDGRDLSGMLHGQESGPSRLLFWEYKGQLAVRDGKWKLVLNGRIDNARAVEDTVHLSDLSQDRGERTNLAEQYPDITSRLTDEVVEWYAQFSKNPAQ
jgi:arylsulfatase A-like enzyme